MLLTVAAAPVMIVATGLARSPANASPDEHWQIELSAPALPATFTPQSLRFGVKSDQFDEGYAPPGESRQEGKPRASGEDYSVDHEIPPGGLQGQEGKSEAKRMDSAKGTAEDEMRLKYEQRAVIRNLAQIENKSPSGQKVQQEQRNATPDADYLKWRGTRIEEMMASQVDAYATDHSSIMTNPMHAERALAYDVAVGECRIKPDQLRKLRVAADWRLLEWVDETDSAKVFEQYFASATIDESTISVWVERNDGPAGIPSSIIDKRENPPLDAKPTSGERAHG